MHTSPVANPTPAEASGLSILIVDDMTVVHEMLATVMEPYGHRLAFASHGQQALALYKATPFDLVLTDVDMAPMDGITLLKEIKEFDPLATVVVMTAFTTTETAIQAIKNGAFDYLTKPYRVDDLTEVLRRCGVAKRKAAQALAVLAARGGPSSSSDFAELLIGESPKSKRLIAQLQKLAAGSTPILLTGELGAGHEAVASALHHAGLTPNGPFVAIDCQSYADSELRAGLVGIAGGPGDWIRQATGGTLFLMNPPSLPKDAQIGFLSVLRKSAGSFRLISSTYEDLDAMSADGRFSEELYYRIATLPVQLPPLRERIDDMPRLLREIALRASNPLFDSRQIEFSEEAVAVLCSYPWPGNLDELQIVVSMAVATTETQVITAAQLPTRIHDAQEYPPLADYLAGMEKQYLKRALARFGGDINRAAAALCIDPAKFA